MSAASDSMLASSARAAPLRMRPDIVPSYSAYQGKKYWVLKEPIGLNYFRFQEEEYAILRMLDGHTSLDEIKERFEAEFTPQKIELSDLQRFIGMLHQSNLVISEITGQGPQLKRRRDEKRRKEVLGLMSNVLAIRFRGFDPERILNWLYPYTRWFFTVQAFVIFCIVGLTALCLVAVEFDVFVARLPSFYEFFGPKNWLLLGLVLGVTKIMHEFGHGLACKRWGGECHEMGIMFLVLTPCLYCNVSDSWMLESKWRRAAISAAGMYVELSLASIATLLWWFSEPGVLNNLCLRIMFVCSLSTLMFNGNPLLRYDGYYILADLVEIPNLRQKASMVTQRILSKWCLGIKPQEDPFLPKRNPVFFATFTVASVVYRWFVVISILMFLNKVFEPYGLKVIGQTIAATGVFGLVVMPLWKLGKFFYTPGRVDQVKWPRFYATLAIAAGVIAGILLLPLPYYVRCTVQVQPLDAAAVYVDVPGRLEDVPVRAGQEVDAGDTLAQLVNLDMQLDVDALLAKRQLYQEQLTGLRYQRFRDPTAGQRIAQVNEIIASIEEQLVEKKSDLERLHLVAPVSGTVLPPPLQPTPPASDSRLPEWSGSPLAPKNRGAHLNESVLLCQIINPETLKAFVIIDQADIDLVFQKIVADKDKGKEDTRPEVWIKLDAFPSDTLESRIDEISKAKLKAAPKSLSTQAGGDLPTQTDPTTGAQETQSVSYQARAALDNPDGALRVGMRGRAKIFVGWKPLGFRIWRYLTTTFHFRL